MLIKIIERCITENYETDEVSSNGIRVVVYDSDKAFLSDALLDYDENFDSDRVVSANDNFEYGCLDSEVVRAEIIKEVENLNWEEEAFIYECDPDDEATIERVLEIMRSN